MNQQFEECLKYVLGNEGGYSNDPDDRGGATKFGITQKSLSNFLKREATELEIKEMSLDVAKTFYLYVYYLPMGLPEIKSIKVATVLFDAAINQGQGTAVKMAQEICGVKIDGLVGPNTLAAINSFDPDHFIMEFHNAVLERYNEIIKNNPVMMKFQHGWENRANRMLTLIA